MRRHPSTEATIRLVVADLAGTTIDFGSCAPVRALVDAFRLRGVDVAEAEVRRAMGRDKREHLRAILATPAVAARWRRRHGGDWTDADADRLYETYLPLQVVAVAQHAGLVPGTARAVSQLRRRGARVAVTTGYDRDLAEVALAAAARQGFVPDAVCTASDVRAGRPAPDLIFRAMDLLGVECPSDVLAVGDTVPDVEAGRNADVWTVGVVRSGNLVGLSAEDVEALDPEERSSRWRLAAEELRAAGAHFTLDTFADVPDLVRTIERRRARAIA